MIAFRTIVAKLLSISVVWLCAPVGKAQTCHEPSLRAHEQAAFRATLGTMFASYRNAGGEGEVWGAHLRAAFMHPRLFAEIAAPYYRLVRDGAAAHGLGDVAADLRVAAYRSEGLALAFGPEFSATFPTGDADKQLGMGHVMLMPGLWLSFSHEHFSLIAQLAYGRAWGAGQHAEHHHHAPTFVEPLVNPMNRSELEHGLGAAFALHPQVRLTARLTGAVPVGMTSGSAREVVSAGAELIVGRWDVSLELHVPVVGSPFSLKSSAALGVQW